MFDWLSHQLSTNQFFSGTAMTGALIAIGAILRQRIVATWHWVLAYYRVSIDVHSEDPSFRVWLDWLEHQKFDRFRRSYRLRTRLDMTPDYGRYCVWYGWRPVWVSMRRDDKQNTHYRTVPMEFITISTYSAKRQSVWFSQVLDDMEKALTLSRAKTVSVYRSDECGYSGSINRQIPSAVILPDGQIEAIEADLEKFYASERDYATKGIPWRRGYLLYGIPGTGKTSLIRHLAKKFATNIYICDFHIPFVDPESCPRPFYVFEDIDCSIQAIRDQAKDSGRALPTTPGSDGATAQSHKRSLGEILNSLDGLVSTDGAVIFMTTNHVDQLDPALIRPGRIDYRIEFGHADAKQINTLADRFFPGIGRLNIVNPMTVSEAQAILQRCNSANEARAILEKPAADNVVQWPAHTGTE